MFAEKAEIIRGCGDISKHVANEIFCADRHHNKRYDQQRHVGDGCLCTLDAMASTQQKPQCDKMEGNKVDGCDSLQDEVPDRARVGENKYQQNDGQQRKKRDNKRSPWFQAGGTLILFRVVTVAHAHQSRPA